VAAPYGREIARQTGAISIYDIKGIRSEEIALIHGRGLRHHVARRIELREMRRAERIGCVSEKLKEWIKVQTGRDDAIVIPCCIDEKRFVFDSVARQQIRQQFGLAEDTQLLCYNGGLGRWQRIEDIVRLFGEVTHLRPSWRFLFLTREGDALTERVRRMGLPLDRCIITGCPHDQVPRYLSAADVGVIMRHDNVVNNTASPIKIGEYLGCGLPIILTREIGDFAEQIRQAGVGLILDESGHTARQVVDFLDHHGDVRGRAVEFCHRHLVFSAYLDRYRQVFRARAGDGGNGGPAVTVNRHAE
jgi:glycosyltransferase involved in cell wall biosynthesis